MTWQPIETAPKDGTYVLAWQKESETPYVAQFIMNKWITDSDNFNDPNRYFTSFCKPTYWMPLPEPPKDEANASTNAP